MNAGQPSPPPRILVVDDNPIIQRAVYFTLRDKGYQVLMVGDIAGAMKTIRAEKLDLVLVDLSFPLDAGGIGCLQQDGFFLIDWILRTPNIAAPPMVVISSTPPAEYQERAAAAGIRACIQKPIDRESLYQAVKAIVGPGTGQPLLAPEKH